MLYKVLVHGRSCNGGGIRGSDNTLLPYVWSLPNDNGPGQWHEHIGELELCKSGLHLTNNPAKWFKPNALVYLAEAEGVVGECKDETQYKVVARRVRLIKQLNKAELDNLGIHEDGIHDVSKGDVVAKGSSLVIASGTATVKAYDNARVVAIDNCSVRAWENATIDTSSNIEVKTDNNPYWKNEDYKNMKLFS